MPVENEGPEPRAQHSTHQRSAAFKELPHVLAAAAARNDRVPAVRRLAATGLAAFDLQAHATIERALHDRAERRFLELTAHAHAELTRQRMHGSLELHGERAIRGD